MFTNAIGCGCDTLGGKHETALDSVENGNKPVSGFSLHWTAGQAYGDAHVH